MIKKKSCATWNLQGPEVLVLGLKISQEGVTQLSGVSEVRLFVRNFQGQSEKPKTSRGGFKTTSTILSYPQSPNQFVFFWSSGFNLSLKQCSLQHFSFGAVCHDTRLQIKSILRVEDIILLLYFFLE